MTDAEIIKAMECRVYPKDSIGQTLYPVVTKLPRELAQQTFDLIKRLQEQNAALIAGQETLQKCIAEKDVKISELEYDLELMIQEKSVVQSKAIKEFANSIKRRLNSNTPRGAYLIDIVDNLVQEMVGEG